MYVTSLFISLLLVSVASAQDGEEAIDCSMLSVGRTDLATVVGDSLNICQFNGDQCCDQTYLDSVRRNVGQDLLDSLRRELSNGISEIVDITELLAGYFEGDFLESYRGNIPFASLIGDSISEVLSGFTTFLNRAQFLISEASPAGVTDTLFEGIFSALERLLPFSDAQNMCIRRLLDTNLNQTAMTLQRQSLDNLRRSFTSISQISTFLSRFNRTLGGFDIGDFPTGCLDRFINISFCSRCRMMVPPICSNTCNGVVRGCFAAFYSGLQREFDSLWDFIGKIVERLVVDLENLFNSEVLEEGLLTLSQLVSDCDITLPPFGKRQASTFLSIPRNIIERVKALRGVFQYGDDGPYFCRVLTNEANFCQEQRNSDSDRSCFPDEVCTSTCTCWNGTEMRPTNTESFTGSSIEEQKDNPYFKDSVKNYETTAASLMVPINAFLTSDEFTTVVPEGVEVPPPAPFGSHSMAPTVSLVITIGAIFFTVLNM